MKKKNQQYSNNKRRIPYLMAYAFPICFLLLAVVSVLFLEAGKYPMLDDWIKLYFSFFFSFLLISLLYLIIPYKLLNSPDNKQNHGTIIFVCLMLGSAIFSFILPQYINGAWDNSEPMKHKNLLLYDKQEVSNAKFGSYHFWVESWRNKNAEEEIVFYDYDLFHKAIPDTSFITVVTRKGYLGYEWIQEYKLQENYSLSEEKALNNLIEKLKGNKR